MAAEPGAGLRGRPFFGLTRREVLVDGLPPVTIVCVYNDLRVREMCLDRSIERLRAEMPAVQYVPVDNTVRQFASAGAALNHGASQAVNEFVVFVHQDVYLHSLAALGRVARAMRDDRSIGLTGAVGISSNGEIVGRMRDRVVLIGSSAPAPVDVDSVDEVLFVIAREQILAEPLSESPDLAWHAYGVEYGLRMRRLGKRVVAMDVPLTHTSMTTNLDRLFEAHGAVADLYPTVLPVRTTCGIVGAGRSDSVLTRPIRSHRWRYRWARNSVNAWQLRVAGDLPVVLNDIRLDIDALLQDSTETVSIVSVDGTAARDGYLTETFRLRRGDREVEFGVTDVAGAARLLDQLSESTGSVLLTNLTLEDLRELRPSLGRSRRLGGYHEGLGCWVLAGPMTDVRHHLWRRQGSTPLLMRSA